MPIIDSFEESKIEYKDEDVVKIKMIRTGMDEESLEHNLYENGIGSILYHNLYLTSNLPIKPKDSGFELSFVKVKSRRESHLRWEKWE
ncbi:hypothetical protein Tco_0448805 [Tanacetum coccineum]